MFDTYIINLPHRADRRTQALEELYRADFKEGDFNFIDAKFTPHNGALGCALSHAYALSKYLFESSNDYCLILEDDFSVREGNSIKSAIDKVLNSDNRWDVFLLGSSVPVPFLRHRLTDNIFRVVNSQTTSAYFLRREYAPTLVKCFFTAADLLARNSSHFEVYPPGTLNRFFAIDMFWKQLQLEDVFLAQIPSVVVQRESFSDIEAKTVHYGV